jgi:tripartite-type tricarboxylate transporter receptor subunit TctC
MKLAVPGAGFARTSSVSFVSHHCACASTLLAALLLAGPAGNAHAQAYPARTVRIVLPFTPGGGADTITRVIAQKLTESTRQQFVVDNRAGANGNLAFELVARSAPDGYTLLVSTPSIVINPSLYRKVPYKLDDFATISLLGKAPLLLVVHPSLPVHTVGELVKLAKAKPGAIRYASTGTGASTHLANEMLRMSAGIDLLHVPYRGGPQALHDVIGGQVEMTILSFAETLPQVRAGRVRALAQTGDKRSPLAPDIPTMQEAGVKGYSAATWYVLFAPTGIPAEVTGRLNAEVAKAYKLPEVHERLKSAGMAEIIGSAPEDAAQFVKREYARWEKVIRASGAKAE